MKRGCQIGTPFICNRSHHYNSTERFARRLLRVWFALAGIILFVFGEVILVSARVLKSRFMVFVSLGLLIPIGVLMFVVAIVLALTGD